MHYITSYAHIKHHQVAVNGNIIFEAEPTHNLSEFLSEAYKSIGIGYPKFHKMDAQCKLGLLCTEFALQHTAFLTNAPLNKTAIVLSNSASSLETDKQYQTSIADKSHYFPSPTVFVYTLPNIVIGEIAIKHKLTGENAFFVSEKMDAQLLVNYAEILLHQNTKAAIVGWVEVDGDHYEAFIFLVESEEYLNKNVIFKPLNQSTVNQLYNQTSWTH
jgi:hypothetical protein